MFSFYLLMVNFQVSSFIKIKLYYLLKFEVILSKKNLIGIVPLLLTARVLTSDIKLIRKGSPFLDTYVQEPLTLLREELKH